MPQIWKSDPQCQVESDSTVISGDSLTVKVIRPENAISRVELYANDYQGKNFIANLDTFDTLTISFRYGVDSWTLGKVFSGIVEEVTPSLSTTGQLVNCLAYGQGRALRNTHCATAYGIESKNYATHQLDFPREIWHDLVDNYINLSFGVSETGYDIKKTKIANITVPSMTYLAGIYETNLDMINKVCQIYTAYQAGSASVHWFVDPDGNLRIEPIGGHIQDPTGWPTWWRTDRDGSTLEEGKDLMHYQFRKSITDFANKVILATQLRKPGWDAWAEGAAAKELWAVSNATVHDDGSMKIVGSNSLRMEVVEAGLGKIYYPKTDAGWDLTKLGTEREPPTINYYIAMSNRTQAALLQLFTVRDSRYFETSIGSSKLSANNVFEHFGIPIGPYYKFGDIQTKFEWTSVGSPVPSWASINGLQITFEAGVADDLWIDDPHFSGKLIREAYNPWSILGHEATEEPPTPDVTAKKEHQVVLRMDTALDDSLKESDGTGTAARIAYAELLRRQKKPLTGMIIVPGIVDILPGQLLHVHADKLANGTNFRVDSDFRVKTITHMWDNGGFTTTLDLTDDLTNTFAKGWGELTDVLATVMTKRDPEAKNLKASGIDPYVARYSKDYPSDDD